MFVHFLYIIQKSPHGQSVVKQFIKKKEANRYGKYHMINIHITTWELYYNQFLAWPLKIAASAQLLGNM